MKRLARGWLVVVVGLWGCGHSTQPGPDPAAGGDGGGAGMAGSPAGDPSLVTHVTLEPGTCGVVRRVSLPGSVESAQAMVARQAGGFSLGPWLDADEQGAQLLRWLLIDSSGERQELLEVTTTGIGYESFVLAGSKLAVLIGTGSGSSMVLYSASVLADGDSTPSDHPLFEAPFRGTNQLLALPALDGQSGVFAVWPTALGAPRAAVLGPQGERVGEALDLAPDGHVFHSCAALQPSAHGVVVSFVDQADDSFRWVELAGDGSVVLDLSTTHGGCPLIAPSADGFALLENSALPDGPAHYQLRRIAPDGTLVQLELRQPAAVPRALVFISEAPYALESGPGGYVFENLDSAGPAAFALDLAGIVTPLAAEPGALFLDVADFESSKRELVELGCAE